MGYRDAIQNGHSYTTVTVIVSARTLFTEGKMWIVATDVRTGQRFAFPALNCMISYDVENYRNNLENNRQLKRITGPLAIESTVLKIKTMLAEQCADADDLEEKLDFIDHHERPQIEEAFKYQSMSVEKLLKRSSSVQAVIFFDRREWPVRGIRMVTSWDDVAAATSVAAEKPEEPEIPPIDGVEGHEEHEIRPDPCEDFDDDEDRFI